MIESQYKVISDPAAGETAGALSISNSTISSPAHTLWWERPSFIFFLLILTAIPLLYPPIPPLIDLPNHMGRYAVQLEIADNTALQKWFRFEWKLIGNLGVDLLVQVFGPIIGLELAVKIIVTLIPVLSTAGFLLVAKEVHGRLPATAILAVSLAYSYPFHFGFVNYCLSTAVAFLGYALLLRLTALKLVRIRFVALLVLGSVAWLCHVYGWALLGLLWFVTELMKNRSRGWPAAIWAATLSSLPLALPLLPMLLWRSGNPAGIEDWFGVTNKVKWIVMILRDRWMAVDVLSAAIIYATLAGAYIWQTRFRFHPALLTSGIVLFTVAMLLPSTIFSSAFADVRLIPIAVVVILLSIRPGPSMGYRCQNLIAAAALTFVVVRTIATTASLAIYSNAYSEELQALKQVPYGSRVASFVEHPCTSIWQDDRLRHLSNIAIIRSSAFVNGQFVSDGWNALQVTYRKAEPFTAFPSSMATASRGCEWPLPTISERIASLPPHTFDYVWLLSTPPARRPTDEHLNKLWSSDNSVLYRIVERNFEKAED